MVSPQLLDYVRQQLAAGSPKEEITKSLVANGWQMEYINEAFATFASSPLAPQSPQQAQIGHEGVVVNYRNTIMQWRLVFGAIASWYLGQFLAISFGFSSYVLGLIVVEIFLLVGWIYFAVAFPKYVNPGKIKYFFGWLAVYLCLSILLGVLHWVTLTETIIAVFLAGISFFYTKKLVADVNLNREQGEVLFRTKLFGVLVILYFMFNGFTSSFNLAIPNGQPTSTQTSVQNSTLPTAGNVSATSGVSSQQTIVAKQSTLLSGASMAFVVSKYPQNAASWSLRVDCGANTTVQLIAVASDLKTPVGKIVNCNEDIALDKAPYATYPQTIIFSMKALNSQPVADGTLTIVSKTFDTAGTILNQSSFPVTVQAYTEGFLKNDLAHIVFQSDSYSYSHQQGGLTGFCTSPDPDGILSIESDLKNISPSVVCKDSQNAWAISVQLPSNPSQYWCADNTIAVNTFAPVVRNSTITTTSCK